MARVPRRKPPEIWQPVLFTPADAYAAKAVDRGEATPDQQKRFVAWLIRATRMRDEIFVPGMEDIRTYLLGRRSVGLQYAALLQWRSPEDANSRDPGQTKGD